MSTVIQLENISKLYRLGTISSGTVRDDFSRWWAKINKKDDPFQKIGERNIQNRSGKSDHIWALKDINLDVQEGDVLGIIGKNGAGKSTLLKILSRITSPTTGITKIKGRIASLLEVGTGFHLELTGRENIYLNGAILGMTKQEIKVKLDEIIDFSGIERYIDTPVKRYSSGMYVRLAFAVAAHLEPEILLIDEVLAVGDISFQAKCLRKMDSIAKQGRTVIFVSHNIGAISSLCTRCLLLDNGKVGFDGNVNDATKIYLQVPNKDLSLEWNGDSGDENLHLLRTWARSMDKEGIFHTSSDIEIGIEINILKDIEGLILGFTLWSEYGYELAYILYDDNEPPPTALVNKGRMSKVFKIPSNTLAQGKYRIEFDIGIHMRKKIIDKEGELEFSLQRIKGVGQRFITPAIRGRNSLFRPNAFLNDSD